MSYKPDAIPDGNPGPKKRTRMVRPYPVHSLEEAAAIAESIQEVNGGRPLDRVLLAKALGTTPASSSFTMKLNSSSKYGLTHGGYSDERIELTARGESLAAPKRSDERRRALLEAALQPELFREFYRALDGRRMPEDEFARNMLQRDHGVRPGLVDECLGIIKTNGMFVGVLGEVGGSLYVSQAGAHAPPEPPHDEAGLVPGEGADAHSLMPVDKYGASDGRQAQAGRILLGHAGASDVVKFLEDALDSFGIGHSSVETEEGDQHPLGQDASRAMRSCHAAVLVHARPESDPEGGRIEARRKERTIFMLGAASALYGDRIVLLREKGLERLPQETSLHTLQFRRENLEELALRLLQELHRMEVIQVRVSA